MKVSKVYAFQADNVAHTSSGISYCTLQNNSADGDGGGISVGGFGKAYILVSIFGSIFSHNGARGRGGGVYFQDIDGLDIFSTIFSQNKAALGNGGGINLQVQT